MAVTIAIMMIFNKTTVVVVVIIVMKIMPKMMTVMIVILIIVIKAQVVMMYNVPWVNYTPSPGMRFGRNIFRIWQFLEVSNAQPK